MLTLRWSSGESQGPPVVLLPGLQGSGSTLLPLARQLAPRWTVRVYDLPGGTLASATATLRPMLHDRPHVVAAGIAGVWACRLPAHQRASVACIGAPLGPERAPWGLRLVPLARPALALAYRATLRRRLERDGVPPELARAAAQASRAPLDRLAWLRAGPEQGPCGPVLWMHGEEDPKRPVDPQVLQGWVPQASCATVSGRHRPFASHPHGVAAVLEAFWAGVLAQTAAPA